MGYWIREGFGWLFICLGLGLFYVAVALLGGKNLVEAGIVTTIGVVVFRGGIHLVKVATAARIVVRGEPFSRPANRKT